MPRFIHLAPREERRQKPRKPRRLAAVAKKKDDTPLEAKPGKWQRFTIFFSDLGKRVRVLSYLNALVK
jgi:hypothetical protein